MTMASKRFTTSDGSVITVRGTTLSWRVVGTFSRRTTVTLPDHPLGRLAVDYLLARSEEWASSSLAVYARHLQALLKYLGRERELTPTTLRAFSKWLPRASGKRNRPRFTPLAASHIGWTVLGLYEHGAKAGYSDWTPRNVEVMREILRHEFRGATREHYLRSAQRAISDQEYEQLLRAAGLEMDACRRILNQRARLRARSVPATRTPFPENRPEPPSGRSKRGKWLRSVLRWVAENGIRCDLADFSRITAVSRATIVHQYPRVATRVRQWAYISGARSLAHWDQNHPLPDPYCVLAVLLGLRSGVRAEEWNLVRIGDLEGGYLTLRSDDHMDVPHLESAVKLEQAAQDAFQILLEWTQDLRNDASVQLKDALQLSERDGRIYRVTTKALSSTRLPRFFKKYFSTHDPERGLPILHAQDHPETPFAACFLKFRNAAIRDFLNHEENPAIVQAFARHRWFETTARSYSQTHAADMNRRMEAVFGPSERVIEMSLQNGVYDRITPELRKLSDAGGETPYGLCGDAGGTHAPRTTGCGLARDCLECPHLYLHVEKRPLLEADAVELAARAEALEHQGLIRDAENVRQAASLRKAHVSRIDQLLAGRRAL